jgi:hypothetical protein
MVPSALAAEGAAPHEAVQEQLRQQLLLVGEGRQAAADVARGEDAELVYQLAGRAGVVGYGDDGREAREVERGLLVFVVPPDVTLDAPQKRSQAGAAADGHEPEFIQR